MERSQILRRVEGYGNLVKIFAAAVIGLVIGIVLGTTIFNSNSVDTELSQGNTASIAEPAVISESSVALDAVTLMTSDPYYTASTVTTTDTRANNTQGRISYHYRGADVMSDPYLVTITQMTADPYYTASVVHMANTQVNNAQSGIIYRYHGSEEVTDPYLTTITQMTADPYYSATP